jgi:hypothetical protein
MPFRLLSAVVCGVVLTASAAMADRQMAAGSRVSMDIPAGFKPAQRFVGFMHEPLSASFLIVEAPAAAFEELKTSLNLEALATRGLTNLKHNKLARNEEHAYVTGIGEGPGGRYDRHLLVIKFPDLAVLVTGNVPQAAVKAGKLSTAAIVKALTSLAVEAQAAQQQDLFVLTELGPFQAAPTKAMQSRLFVQPGAPVGTPAITDHPLFIVAPSIDARAIGDVGLAARTAILSVAGAKIDDITEASDVTIDGLKGVALTATGTTIASGTPLLIYQVLLLLPEGGFFRMIGMTPGAEAATNLPHFKAMAASFKRTQPKR